MPMVSIVELKNRLQELAVTGRPELLSAALANAVQGGMAAIDLLVAMPSMTTVPVAL